jgi:hypothetical protein
MFLQVRTLNFLTMMMRNFPAELEAHVNDVCKALFYLFRSAPDSIAVRRELLAATRYVLTGPQKSACFAGVIDDVLAEGVLLGSSMASMESLRQLSVSDKAFEKGLHDGDALCGCRVLHQVGMRGF